ncbi:peptidoglycan glycosyltransferase FtsW [Ketogulonicigenium vulgare]|uniref:Probable peptidoglycan glycosyltransferase FtsW n=1 Tax=Ketogulonicigenium vulgare (strain WSH-001) TaxID=759362 RepID=F9Y9A6_KETVW|nr:putative peptidoglycan glycosyltransferase FtsW [Ketogulonicigenium vulgare]ADO41546.1 cell division protein FtsW [Ketogulonicigenium vulgare Y25]AEM41323.1 Cell division protein FtsW [Ketogulonicigenium vulgare WSH-001]ALJ81463.1 cell division protein FtsW [Ketogulonicigenium vulgare]ANW34178.1 cell division protein FtsW [Ketogulonicigenium vulgare]AOZ55064.1 cell division protein FtsW [Ketogulonicigenium vulgare]
MTDMVYRAAAVQQVGDPVLPRWWRTIDKLTFGCILVLFALGLLLGLAASAPLAQRLELDSFYFVVRQAVFGIAAITLMLMVSMLSPRMIRRLGVVGFVFAFASLAALPFVGTDFGKGAVRWFSLGVASFQPSEVLKPFFIVVTAWLLVAGGQEGGPPGKRISLLLTAVIVIMLALQPDFGQAALIIFTWTVMYFVAGAPMVLLMGLAGIVAGGGVIAYNSSDHFARRINSFLAEEFDPRSQIGFATNAIREGGFFGVGVGQGQVKWSLPDAHTDFIIAVAAEEYGLLLVGAIILLFLVIVVRSLFRLMRERDPFIRLAGTGLATVFGVQAMINMGVAVRLLPAKGMTLPFVSYGGSSLMAAGLSVGMLMALTRARPQGLIGDILLRQGRR